MEIEQRIYLGDRAKEVLENETFIDAFEQLEQGILEQWQNSPARDSEGREKLFLMMGLTRKLKAILQTTMETGTLAKYEIQHKQNLYDKAKDYLSGNWQD